MSCVSMSVASLLRSTVHLDVQRQLKDLLLWLSFIQGDNFNSSWFHTAVTFERLITMTSNFVIMEFLIRRYVSRLLKFSWILFYDQIRIIIRYHENFKRRETNLLTKNSMMTNFDVIVMIRSKVTGVWNHKELKLSPCIW